MIKVHEPKSTDPGRWPRSCFEIRTPQFEFCSDFEIVVFLLRSCLSICQGHCNSNKKKAGTVLTLSSPEFVVVPPFQLRANFLTWFEHSSPRHKTSLGVQYVFVLLLLLLLLLVVIIIIIIII
jgi:hypothetical protein